MHPDMKEFVQTKPLSHHLQAQFQTLEVLKMLSALAQFLRSQQLLLQFRLVKQIQQQQRLLRRFRQLVLKLAPL
jgi:hypothetical protein